MSNTPRLLEAHVEHDDETPALHRRIEFLEGELERMRQELRSARNETSSIKHGVAAVRRTLEPLHNALRVVFGEMDAAGIESSAEEAKGQHPTANSRVAAAWESWKQKLGGLQARFIEALLLHGEMTGTQLRIVVGCATGSVSPTISHLNKAGLIFKNGNKYRLKEL